MDADDSRLLLKSRWQILAPDEVTDEWWTSWDELNTDSLRAHPVLSARMVRLLVKFFGTRRTRLAALCNGERRLAQAAIEPLRPGQWRIFCPSQSPIALLVYSQKVANVGAQLLQKLLRYVSSVGVALHIPYQDGPFSWVGEAQSRVLHRALIGDTVTIRPTRSFDEYWSGRPKELRDNIRRRSRRMTEDGLNTILNCIDEASVIGDAVDRYGELESRGWKGKEGSALHPTNQQGRFYRELLEVFARVGEGRVYELWLEQRLAASRLVISGGSMHIVLKTTHDEELRRYAPGHVQLHGILRDLLLQPGSRAVELYTKADRDWLLWSTHTREIANFTLYRNSLVARAADWRRQRGVSIADNQSPNVAAADDAGS